MTEGISKERLIEIFEAEVDNGICSVKDLIKECTELDPWIPIDENTPKDIELLGWLERGYRSLIHWSELTCHWLDDSGNYVTPTHYKLLPEDPK